MKHFVGLLICLLLIFVLLGIIKGAGPTIGQDGWLKWDYTGMIARQENETERERIRQQNETERNEDNAQALQTIAIVAAVAGCIVVYVVQTNRTKRKIIEAVVGVPQWPTPKMLPGPQQAPPQLPPVVNLYINYLIPGKQGKVIDVGGVPMIQDDSRRRLIPLDVAEQELATLGLLSPPVRRLTGPTIDGA